MKKLLLSVLSLVVSGAMTLGSAQSETALAVHTSTSLPSNDRNSSGSPDVITKARQNFSKAYKSINNETWFPSGDGLIANFLLDGKDYRVAYNDNGQWKYTELTYSEDKLPPSVRETVKREFFDYEIQYCSEFIKSNFKAYIITMKGRDSERVIKVQFSDDDMQIVADRKTMVKK